MRNSRVLKKNLTDDKHIKAWIYFTKWKKIDVDFSMEKLIFDWLELIKHRLFTFIKRFISFILFIDIILLWLKYLFYLFYPFTPLTYNSHLNKNKIVYWIMSNQFNTNVEFILLHGLRWIVHVWTWSFGHSNIYNKMDGVSLFFVIPHKDLKSPISLKDYYASIFMFSIMFYKNGHNILKIYQTWIIFYCILSKKIIVTRITLQRWSWHESS